MPISVKDPVDDSSVPFLRGILTRSLQAAGLSFEQAYDTANRVKNELQADQELSPVELAQIVIRRLRNDGQHEVAGRYEQEKGPINYSIVLDRDGLPQPFSKSRLSQSLEVCSLDPERAFELTASLEQIVLKRGFQEITSDDLICLTYKYLKENELEEVSRRYAVWIEFSRSGQPLILLIGGTTGSGKSTIGADVAHRLNIIRTQSTDMLREVMRLMLPRQLVPELHVSSFNAWQTLPTADETVEHPSTQDLEQGYLIQANQVAVAVEGVISRAVTERVSLILEGIHIHPGLQNELRASTDAIVVPIVLAVLKRKQLRKQLKGRGHHVTTRRAERYLDHFEEIWSLQTLLLNEADRHDIVIVASEKLDDTLKLVMDSIVEHLTVHFPGNLAGILSEIQ
ncbi:MAG: ATP cone domain-containing protein [Rhodothermia bacterium]